jgi:hypothetical protein
MNIERNLLREATERRVFRAAFDIASEILVVDPEGAIDLARRLTEQACLFAISRATALQKAGECQPVQRPLVPARTTPA